MSERENERKRVREKEILKIRHPWLPYDSAYNGRKINNVQSSIQNINSSFNTII